jgi:hypothetical protein
MSSAMRSLQMNRNDSMTRRPELQPPAIDEALVSRLSELAAEIDGARDGEWEERLEEFNRLSPTALEYEDFQGIYGGEEHEEFVRRLLTTNHLPVIDDLSREDIVAAFQRILDPECPQHEQWYLIKTLSSNLDDPQISDLVYWPNAYFNKVVLTELSPEQMAEAVLERRQTRRG